MSKFFVMSISAIAVRTLVSSVEAAVINSGPAQNISGPTDVQTAGSVVDKAARFYWLDSTINGVNFTDIHLLSMDTGTGISTTYGGDTNDGITGN